MEPEKELQLREELKAHQEQRQRNMGWLQRRFGCFGDLLSLIIVLILSSLIYMIFDAAASPWAYSFFGTQPTLVGEWTGAFTTPGGMRGIVYLNLQHPYAKPSGNGDSLRRIEGMSQSCVGSHEVRT